MQPVERADYEGVDYGWVMQMTFVVTILVGAPVVAVLSAFVTLDSWGARAAFAVRVGAPIWFVTAVAVAVYARRTEAGDGGTADAGDTADSDADDAAAADDAAGDTDDATAAADDAAAADEAGSDTDEADDDAGGDSTDASDSTDAEKDGKNGSSD